MAKPYEEYINATAGNLIILVEHKLNTTMPRVALFEPVNLTDFKAVPLYDARIGSIESNGPNITQIEFTSPFEGRVQLIFEENTRDSIESRLANVEDLLDLTIAQQKQLTTLSQWKQMNNLFDQEHADLNAAIAEINSIIDGIKADIDSL